MRMNEPLDISNAGIRRTGRRDVVIIRGMGVETTVGVHENERVRPRRLRMDIDIETDGCDAGRSDSLNDTVDYAAVVADVREHLTGQCNLLLERIAETVSERILHRFGASAVRVRITKAGMLDDVEEVGVIMERTRFPDESVEDA